MPSITRALQIFIYALLLCGLGLAQALIAGPAAAATAPTSLSYDIEDIVAPAQQTAYEAGVKSYNQCLKQHAYKFAERGHGI